MKLLPGLHRADTVPQWETIPEEDWNEHQRRAAETNGWDTPGNRRSAMGALKTVTGLALIYMDKPATTALGGALVIAGRVDDLRDGRDAERTGTKSPKGEAIDAGLDGLLMFMAAVVAKRKDIIPAEAADELMANTVVKGAASAVARLTGHEIHTGRVGKYGTFLRWGDFTARFGQRVSEHFGREDISEALEVPTELATEVGLKMDRQATAGYVRDALFGPHVQQAS